MLKFHSAELTFPHMNKLNQILRRIRSILRVCRPHPAVRSSQGEIDRRIRHALVEWLAAGKHRDEYPSMESVATELGFSREQLSFFFSNSVRQRFSSWRKELRIEEAKALLLEYPDLPASAIGAMVGIPDKSNFRRQFQELTGCTPGEWRAACLGKEG